MEQHSPSHYIVPVRVYLAVFAALMVLLILTVWVAFHHWGVFNPIVAMTIAVAKAAIVILYFMHVRYSDKLVWLFVCSGFVWLALLIMFTISDYVSRAWIGAGTPF